MAQIELVEVGNIDNADKKDFKDGGALTTEVWTVVSADVNVHHAAFDETFPLMIEAEVMESTKKKFYMRKRDTAWWVKNMGSDTDLLVGKKFTVKATPYMDKGKQNGYSWLFSIVS